MSAGSVLLLGRLSSDGHFLRLSVSIPDETKTRILKRMSILCINQFNNGPDGEKHVQDFIYVMPPFRPVSTRSSSSVSPVKLASCLSGKSGCLATSGDRQGVSGPPGLLTVPRSSPLTFDCQGHYCMVRTLRCGRTCSSSNE